MLKSVVVAAMLAACAPEEGRRLRVAERVPLDDPAATLAVDAFGRHWLGRPGAIRVRDDTGSVRDLQLPAAAVPRVVGWMNGSVYLRLGDGLVAADARGDSVRAARGGIGQNPLLCDVRGRAVLQGARSGAVIAHHPDSLAPSWAWAALGARTTALAASPLGDRIYQALEFDDGDRAVLVRDLQTGRELGRMEVELPLEQLVAGEDGTLYGAGRDGRRIVIVALRPGGGELELVWRRPLPLAQRDAGVHVAVARAQVAVWGRGPEEGLRILDALAGDVLARTDDDPLDFSFGPGGELWALYPGVLRRLE